MKLHNFGNVKVSEIVYGMWRICDSNLTSRDVVLLLEELKVLGINTIDTAAIYGGEYHNAEKALGEAILMDESITKNFKIISKCGIECRSEVNHYDNTYEYIMSQVNTSLNSLKIKTLDVLLLHRPDIFMDFAEVYRAMKDLKTQNKVLEFGVSNFTPVQFSALNKYLSKRGISLVTNQIEINTYTTEHFDNDNVFYLKGEEISPMIWSPMGGGKLFTDNDVSDVINEIGLKNNLSRDQVVVSFLVSQGLNPVIILGSNKVERFKSASTALDVKLCREDMYKILKTVSKKDVR